MKGGIILTLLVMSIALAASSFTERVRADNPTPIILTLSPTNSFGNWSNEDYAYSQSGYSATSSANGDQSTFNGYGFVISPDATILQVRVRLDALCSYPSDDQIRLMIPCRFQKARDALRF